MGVTSSGMDEDPTNSRRNILARLSKELEGIMKEQRKLVDRMNQVTVIVQLLTEDPDAELNDGFNLDEEVNLDDDDDDSEDGFVEYDGVTYQVGDKVLLYDARTRKWLPDIWKIQRFRPTMVFMKRGGKETRRKYGNFKLVKPKAKPE